MRQKSKRRNLEAFLNKQINECSHDLIFLVYFTSIIAYTRVSKKVSAYDVDLTGIWERKSEIL